MTTPQAPYQSEEMIWVWGAKGRIVHDLHREVIRWRHQVMAELPGRYGTGANQKMAAICVTVVR